MGCVVEVGGSTPGETEMIERIFRARDRQFSRFREDSELSRVNRAPHEIVTVSKTFGRMVERARTAAAATGGLVDPTLAGALAAAGYDRDFDELEPRAETVSRGGRGRWRDVRMLGRLLVRPAGVELDLNGVVKGQTVDEAVGLLSGDGFVTAGGDYAGNGEFDVALPGGGSVRVTRGGLATSGTTKRRWLRAGVWQHHLIDPRSGAPADSPWAEVTVSAGTCLQADVAAKAAFLLGPDGPAWLDSRGLAGRFLPEDGPPILNEVWRGSVAAPVAA